jgi:predicted nucleotidyltransferase
MSLEIADRQLEDFVSRRALARLRAFRRDAEKLFPGRVADVVLFGSRARGDAKRKSDYDVAVFVRDLQHDRAANHALSDLAYRHLLNGYYIAPILLDAGFLKHSASGPLRYSIARDGIRIP